MPKFDITYKSNLEIGQIVQKCESADAFITAEPSYERDAKPIAFTATLSPLGRDGTLDDSGGEVLYWQTRKHCINTYTLNVKPRIGTTHHNYRDIPLDETFRHNIPFQGNRTAFTRVSISRKESFTYDIPYNFFIEENLNANAEAPIHESPFLAALLNDFPTWPQQIPASAAKFSVPGNLILAIAVMETTHGWYDEPLEWIGKNKSIRPMNINVAYWPQLFSAEDMHDQAKNFDAGAFMLKRIIERLAPNDRTIRKIATLYRNLNAIIVDDYGARVEAFSKALNPYWLAPSPLEKQP